MKLNIEVGYLAIQRTKVIGKSNGFYYSLKDGRVVVQIDWIISIDKFFKQHKLTKIYGFAKEYMWPKKCVTLVPKTKYFCICTPFSRQLYKLCT